MQTYFFNLHNENLIGFKELTSSDMGRVRNGQTHIGLLSKPLLFLPNDHVAKLGLLLYENNCEILTFYFDRILRETGRYESPKIRSGRNQNSITVRIREIVDTDPKSKWFLVWAGLESEEVVFWLIKEGSPDYFMVKKIFSKNKEVLDNRSPVYQEAVDCLMKKTNFESIDIQKDIEIISQIGGNDNRYKKVDIEKADRLFKEIGKKGEELVASFLDKQKHKGRIQSYIWENQSRESGSPYDFVVNEEEFVDVKSTRFNFEQYIFYSNQEIEFATTKDVSHYTVFRVFDLDKEIKKLSICNNCLKYMQRVSRPIVNLKTELKTSNTLLQTLKVGVMPHDCFLEIHKPIIL